MKSNTPTQVPLGDSRPEGISGCGFGIDPDLCDEPATIHLMWIESHENVLACTKHFNEYLAPRVEPGEVDLHKFGGMCNMPGTRWYFSSTETEGFCAFGMDSVTESEAAELVAHV